MSIYIYVYVYVCIYIYIWIHDKGYSNTFTTFHTEHLNIGRGHVEQVFSTFWAGHLILALLGASESRATSWELRMLHQVRNGFLEMTNQKTTMGNSSLGWTSWWMLMRFAEVWSWGCKWCNQQPGFFRWIPIPWGPSAKDRPGLDHIDLPWMGPCPGHGMVVHPILRIQTEWV